MTQLIRQAAAVWGACVLAAGPALAVREPVAVPAKAAPAAKTDTTSGGDYVKSLKPVAGAGPGVVVGEPVASGGNAALADFGTGCSVWLQFALGSQGQFGQIPTYRDIGLSRRWVLKKTDFRLEPKDVRTAATDLGLTYVVTAAMSGTPAACHLTYTIYKRDGTVSGAPIVVTGTEAQIIAALPKTAVAIVKRVSPAPAASDASLPGVADFLPEDAETVGHLWNADLLRIGETDRRRLWSVATHSPLGGLLLTSASLGNPALFDHLLTQVGHNPLALALLADSETEPNSRLSKAVDAAQAVFPHSYAVAVARSLVANRDGLAIVNTDGKHFDEVKANADVQRADGELAATLAPKNPWAWIHLKEIVFTLADNVRHTRAADAMTEEERDFISSAYPSSESVMRRATELSPQNGVAWLNLSTMAMFNHDVTTADEALDAAMKLDPKDEGVYDWGLQLYQPTGDDNQDKLLTMAVTGVAQCGVVDMYPAVEPVMTMLDAFDPRTIALKKTINDYIVEHDFSPEAGKLWKAAAADPRSYDAWLAAWKAADKDIDAVSQSRPLNRLSPQERQLLDRMKGLRFEASKRLVTLKPDSSADWVRVARSGFYNDDAFGFTAAVKKALELDPHNREAFVIGLERYQPQWYNDLAELLDVATKASADPDTLHRTAGPMITALQSALYYRVFARATDEQLAQIVTLVGKAKKAMAETAEGDSTDPVMLEAMVDYQAGLGHKDKALEASQAWAKAIPDDPRASEAVGKYAAMNNDYEASLAGYEKAYSLDPKNSEVLAALVNLQVVARKDADVETHARQLIALAPLRALGQYALGRSLAAQGKYAEALKALQKAADLDVAGNDHGWDARAMIAALQPASADQQTVVDAWHATGAIAKDIAAGANGALWVTALEKKDAAKSVAYQWTKGQWVKEDGPAERIAVDPDGVAWVVTPDHTIARWKAGKWETVPGAATDIGIGPEGSVWIVGTDSRKGGFLVSHWDGTDWVASDGVALQVGVDIYGRPWTANSDGKISVYAEKKWQTAVGAATDFGAGLDGSIWSLLPAADPETKKLQRWNGSGWDNAPGEGTAITAGPDGTPWTVHADGSIQAGVTLPGK